MEKYMAKLGFVAFIAFFVLIFGPLAGGICGWIFAAVFDESFRALLSILRVDATGFQMGAALGFLGAFMRTTVFTKEG